MKVREENSRQIREYEEETHRKYRQALDMDFDVDVGLMEERKALETAGMRDAEEQLRHHSLSEGRAGPDGAAAAAASGSRTPSADGGGGEGSRSRLSAESTDYTGREYPSTSTRATFSWRALSSALPSLAFSSDADHLDDPYGKRKGNYDIQSKPSSSKPSMMQIWSGGDDAPTSSAQKVTPQSLESAFQSSTQHSHSLDGAGAGVGAGVGAGAGAGASSSVGVRSPGGGSQRTNRALEASARASFTSSNMAHQQALLDATNRGAEHR